MQPRVKLVQARRRLDAFAMRHRPDQPIHRLFPQTVGWLREVVVGGFALPQGFPGLAPP